MRFLVGREVDSVLQYPVPLTSTSTKKTLLPPGMKQTKLYGMSGFMVQGSSCSVSTLPPAAHLARRQTTLDLTQTLRHSKVPASPSLLAGYRYPDGGRRKEGPAGGTVHASLLVQVAGRLSAYYHGLCVCMCAARIRCVAQDSTRVAPLCLLPTHLDSPQP